MSDGLVMGFKTPTEATYQGVLAANRLDVIDGSPLPGDKPSDGITRITRIFDAESQLREKHVTEMFDPSGEVMIPDRLLTG
jgi:hypothetical protein